MSILTVDFETYYDKEYSLSKMTTEEYIRDKRFHVVGVAVQEDGGPPEWCSGPPQEIMEFLHQYDWDNSLALAHNMMFDGAILSWRCGIRPKGLLDTLSMSRALFGVDERHSLKALATRLGLGVKGTEVQQAIGKRRKDFTPKELRAYGGYCKNDVTLCRDAFAHMVNYMCFPQSELKLIDVTLRMFTDPVLDLDIDRLRDHLLTVKMRKEHVIAKTGVDKKTLGSAPKFAALLEERGITPPTKISQRTGKEAYAFAKTDRGFQALLEHDDPEVQALAAARIGTKSTIEESRTERFISIAERGSMPVPVRYYAAHTGRWGGADKINLQNLPSRGPNAKELKSCIIAPEGHTIIEADSSQIEARVLAWWAEQNDLVEAFRRKDDVYKNMASTIYNVPVEDVDGSQRFVGKTTILGAGYGMGHVRFREQLNTFGFSMELGEADRVINVYRKKNGRISSLWRAAQAMVRHLAKGKATKFGRDGVVRVDPDKEAIILPNGLPIFYKGIRAERGEDGDIEYVFDTRKGPSRIYGGKVVENVCQALARIIIGHQMLLIAKRYKVALTVHDSIVICVPDHELTEAREFVEHCMRQVPDWAEGLPIDCEAGVAKSYGECE